MANQPGGWLSALSNLIIPAGRPAADPAAVSNGRILDELVACFDESIRRESVGASMLFNAHFLIILHPDTYEERQNAFPVIVDEAVRAFNAVIDERKAAYQRVAPVASSWFFKFGAGREFAGESLQATDVRVVGALTGILPGNSPVAASPNNRHMTRRVQQTNRYEKVDVDLSTFQHIDFREPGAFVVKFSIAAPSARPQLLVSGGATVPASLPPRPDGGGGLAQLDYYMAETNQEHRYLMRDREIVVARQEPENQAFPNYLLLESAYVSNPHARIRYNDTTRSFEIASFSRNETRVNEQLVPRSEPASPHWFALPDAAQVLLNSMVTLTFSRLVAP